MYSLFLKFTERVKNSLSPLIFILLLTNNSFADISSNDDCSHQESWTAFNNISGTLCEQGGGVTCTADATDYYQISVPTSGRLNVSYATSPDRSTDFYFSKTGCGNNRVADNQPNYSGFLDVTSGDTVYIRIQRNVNNAWTNYNINFSFTPSSIRPTASVSTLADITVAGGTAYTARVTYSDSDGTINASSIGTNDIAISGMTITNATIISGSGTATTVVDYTFTPPNGTWDTADNATYTVNLGTGPVFDNVNATVASLGGDTSFTVNIPIPPSSFANNNWRLFNMVNYSGNHNMNGDMTIIGNSIMVKKNGAGWTCPTLTERNNIITATYADIDSNSSTFNSSSAQLILPATATDKEIVWAGLYWQGYLVNENDTTKSNAKNVLLKTPTSSSYINLTSDSSKFNWLYVTGSAFDRFYYQGSTDITAIVKSAGEGSYTIANLYSSTLESYSGNDLNTLGGAFGAWSIVVVYKNSNTTLKNISIFDGYVSIGTVGATTSGPVFNDYNISLSGFLTPSAGTINSSFLIFAGEGDVTGTGDSTKLSRGANLTDLISLYNPLNPSNDIYNASITDKGIAVTTRNPSCQNTIGADIDIFNVGSTASSATTQGPIIQNNQTQTRVNLTSSGDGYFPGIFAFATDIYQPFITIQKSSNSSGTLMPNQLITYTANIKNTGNENAVNIVIYDNFRDNNLSKTDGTPTSPLVTLEDILDHNTTEISNSIICKYGPSNTSCKNDCTVTASPLKVSCKITLLDINQTASVEFRTKIAVNPDTKGQNVEVENKMYATYTNALTGLAISQAAESNAASAGLYMAMADSLFNAWESSLSNANPILYTKAIGNNISFDIGKKDGANYTGSICAQLVGGGFTSAYQCLTYNDVATQTFVWNGITTADQSVYVNIKNIPIQNQTDPSIGTWSNSISTDTFSIRPDHFVFNTAGLPANLRAGEDYTFAAVTAVPQTGTTPVVGYNQSKASLTLSPDKLGTHGAIDNSLNGTLAFSATNFNFADGTTNAMEFTYDDVGRVTIKLDDTNWCSTDAGDGTPLSARTISGNTTVTFIPFDFNVSNVTIQNDNGTGFTYLSSDLNMAAEVGMTITARNMQGATTQNYANNLFEKTISITPTIKHDLLDANRTAPLNQDLNFINGAATVAWTDAASARFNFDRNASRPVNPFDVNGSDMNLTVLDTDNVRGDANQTATGFARFYYGRAHAPDYRFPNADGNATIYYEVYCKDCNTTKYVNNWNESVNAINWYQNPLHVNTAGGVAPTPQIPANFSNTAVTNTNPISTQRLTLRNTTTIPYVDRITLNSNSWLIAFPTNFTVEFYNSGVWVGSGFVKQDHANAVDDNTTVGGFVHQTAPTKANRRMTW